MFEISHQVLNMIDYFQKKQEIICGCVNNNYFMSIGAIWMEDAQLSNVIYSHPEDRLVKGSEFFEKLLIVIYFQRHRNAHNSGTTKQWYFLIFIILTFFFDSFVHVSIRRIFNETGTENYIV